MPLARNQALEQILGEHMQHNTVFVPTAVRQELRRNSRRCIGGKASRRVTKTPVLVSLEREKRLR